MSCEFKRLKAAIGKGIVGADKEMVLSECSKIVSRLEQDAEFMKFFNKDNSEQDLRSMTEEKIKDALYDTIDLSRNNEYIMYVYNTLSWDRIKAAYTEDIFEYLMSRIS